MWREEPLGALAEIRMGQSPDSSSYNGVGIGPAFLQGCAEFGKLHPHPEYYCSQPGKIAPEGAVLISVRAPVGELNIADQEYCIGRGLAAVIGRDINSKFLYYSLALNRHELARLAQGSTFDAVGSKELNNHLVYYPENNRECEKLVQILETTDESIEKTEALIAKYEQIKQGMMQDLFTRGVDENGQLRPPYEEAPHLYKETKFGWLPVDWQLQALSELAPLVTSGSRDWARYYADAGDIFVRIGNMTRSHVNFRMENVQYVNLKGVTEGTRTKLEKNDILISITADLGIIGVVPEWPISAYINQHIALVRCDEKVIRPRYLGHFLASRLGQKQFEMLNESGAKAGLNLPSIRALNCYVPNIDEQAFIENSIDRIDKKISELHREHLKLSWVKQGLMQDLLTGKVPVRVTEEEQAA